MHKLSLVACILSTIVIIHKVVTIEDLSINQNSNASEHHMPGVPVQDSINTCVVYIVWHGFVHARSGICCMCVCAHTMLTESAD